MTVPTLRFDTLLLPGMGRAVGMARRWLMDVLENHPALDDATLCTSELLTNAIRYTESGRDGQIRVELSYSDELVRVEVADDGDAESVPHLITADETDVCGRGLLIVAFLSTAWGVRREGKGHAVWFEIHHP